MYTIPVQGSRLVGHMAPKILVLAKGPVKYTVLRLNWRAPDYNKLDALISNMFGSNVDARERLFARCATTLCPHRATFRTDIVQVWD
jgi:hypothetical protein